MSYTILEEIKIRLRQFHIEEAITFEETSNKIVFDKLEENPILEVLIQQNKDLILLQINPPEYYEQEQIDELLEKYRSAVIEMTLYDVVKEGGEFERTHTEPGITRAWIDKQEIMNYFNVHSFAKVI